MQQRIQEFVNARFGDQVLPSDLKKLLEGLGKPQSLFAAALGAILKRNASVKDKVNLTSSVGAEFLWPDKTYALLDHDYLNDQDYANSDTMANVRAMRDTGEMLRFVLQYKDGSLLGYWQPDLSAALDSCVLFWLDTEGQYVIAEGCTVVETLAYRALLDGNTDLYQEVLRTFKQLGIAVLRRDEETIFAEMDDRKRGLDQTPEQYHLLRYEHYRGKPAGAN